jgi:cytochrome bd-type quinol oxidase subunit 2
LVQALRLLVAVLAVCRVWTLVWLAVQAAERAAREQLAQAHRVKATTVEQALTLPLVPVAAVVVLVLLVRQRRQAQAATAALVCKVRSPARQSFMAVERVAARTAAPLVQVAAVAVRLVSLR